MGIVRVSESKLNLTWNLAVHWKAPEYSLKVHNAR